MFINIWRNKKYQGPPKVTNADITIRQLSEYWNIFIFGAKKEDQSPQEAHESCKDFTGCSSQKSQTFSITTPILNRNVSDKLLWHYKFDGFLFPGSDSHN